MLLVVAAGGLWAASRLPWVVIRSFDGLGPPKATTLSGASWSSALVPLAVVLLVAAVAALGVRGWPLAVLAVVLAAASLPIGYLAVSMWVVPDVAARGADLAHVPLSFLIGSTRQYAGATIALAAAVCTLAGAVALMRVARASRRGETRYVTPAARRSQAPLDDGLTSERMIWDALDEGRDPTDQPRSEGR